MTRSNVAPRLNQVVFDGTQGLTNLLYNSDLELWTAGTAVAPDGWTLSGASAVIAREASTIKIGTYSAKMTRAGTDCILYQQIHTDKGINYWKGRMITFSCWVYATVANRVRLGVNDGVTTSYSSYHTGSSTWEYLTITKILSASATIVQANLGIDTGDTSGYFDGGIIIEGEKSFAFNLSPLDAILKASRFKTGTITRDLTAASGDVSYTGIGFKPSQIIFIMGCDTGSYVGVTIGFDDATNHTCIEVYTSSGATASYSAYSIFKHTTDGVNSQKGLVKSMDIDGFTITYTKTGTPSAGTLNISWIACR